MQGNKRGILMIFLVVLVSLMVVIIPTFFTKGISRVVLHKAIDLPLILNDEKDIKLLFFGYSGCADICTPRLSMIDKLYDLLSSESKRRVGVEFLDISVPVDEELPQRFASFFNKEFKGIYLTKDLLRKYTKAFDVYFSPSLMDKGGFDHTAHLYLLKRSKGSKELRYIYTAYPYDIEQIIKDIQELMNE